MTGLDLLRHTHPTLIEESIAAFERIIARSEQIGRELEAQQARIERRLSELQPEQEVKSEETQRDAAL